MPQLTAATKTQMDYQYFTFQVIKNDKEIVHTHTLIVNPEDLTQDEEARNEITRTIAGAYIEEWGRDFISFVIKGTTGFKKRVGTDGRETDGFQAFKDLRDNVYRYFLEPDGMLKQKRTDKNTYELRYYDWEAGEYYAIMPRKFSLQRSKSRPLLYAYDFQFIGYRPLLAKNTDFKNMISLTTSGQATAKTKDNVVNAAYNIDTVIKNAMTAIAAAVDDIETALTDPVTLTALGNVNFPSKSLVVSPLMSVLYLSEANYPGITALLTSAVKVKAYTAALRVQLLKYSKREVSVVGAYTSELVAYAATAKTLCTALSALTVVPNHLIVSLRSLNKQLLLLSKFPKYFKDNASSEEDDYA